MLVMESIHGYLPLCFPWTDDGERRAYYNLNYMQ